MDFERDYQIRILSKNFYLKGQRFYSTLDNPKNETNINPWFLTGLLDGEGCFRISLKLIEK